MCEVSLKVWRCKYAQKAFSGINALWPWPLTQKSIGYILNSRGVFVWSFMIWAKKRKILCTKTIFRNHCIVTFHLLTRNQEGISSIHWSLYVKFQEYRCKGKVIMQHEPFSVIMHCDLDLSPFDPKSRRHILNSLGVFVWSFIGVKRKQFCDINNFQLSMHCYLDLWIPKSIEHILDSWRVFVWRFMMIGVKGKQLCNRNHFQLAMHCDLNLQTQNKYDTFSTQGRGGGLCVKFHDVTCKGKAIMRRNHLT